MPMVRVPNGASGIEFTGPFDYSFDIYKASGGWGNANGSQVISTGVQDGTYYPAVKPRGTSGYGDNVGVTLSYNANNGNLTISGNSQCSTNDACTYHVEGQAFLFKKTFFDFSMTLSKSGSGWGQATGSASIPTGIIGENKTAIVYLMTSSGYGDNAYINASYNSATGIVTLSGNTFVNSNNSWSGVVSGVVLLV